MQEVTTTGAQPESQFAAMVDALAADPDGRARLTDLLRENHPVYDQRGAAARVRMRGWVLLGLARAGVSDDSLIFVLKELDAGTDGYLVAAAARALRSYPRPDAALAPFVMRALTNIRRHDVPVSFERYGEYAVASAETTTVRELLATLAWLGPHARGVLPEVEALRSQQGGLPEEMLGDVGRAAEAIRGAGRVAEADAEECCALPQGVGDALSRARGSRCGCETIDSVEALGEKSDAAGGGKTTKPVNARARGKAAAPVFGTLASLAVALFPKCPICWAAYLSVLGVAGLHRIPYSPWLKPVFVSLMLVNLASVWLRGRSTGRMGGFYLVGAGTVTILVAKLGLGLEQVAVVGVALTLAGSLLSALSAKRRPQSIDNSSGRSVLD